MGRNDGRKISRRWFLRCAAALGIAAAARQMGRLLGAPLDARASFLGQEPEEGDGEEVYLPLVARDAGPGTAARGPSKLGFHTLNPGGAPSFVEAARDAGAHVALVKALGNFGYLRRVKEISPETTTVARCAPGDETPQAVDIGGDPAERAARLMAQHMPRWEYEADVVDYWEILNENKPPTVAGHVWLAQFFIEAMDIAEANGHKLAIFSYSTGVPQWHEWEAIVETGVFARAKAGGHALALHEYDWPVINQRWNEPTEDLPPYGDRGVLAGRYRYLYRDFLIPRDEVVPLVITEGGLDPVVGGPDMDQPWQARYVDNMAWYDTLMREDDYVVGSAMFTLGSIGGWQRYDYEELLWPGNEYGSNFLDYIVSLKDA